MQLLNLSTVELLGITNASPPGSGKLAWAIRWLPSWLSGVPSVLGHIHCPTPLTVLGTRMESGGGSLRIAVSRTGECVMSVSCPGEGSAACQLLDPVWTTLRLMGNILYPSVSLRPGALCLIRPAWYFTSHHLSPREDRGCASSWPQALTLPTQGPRILGGSPASPLSSPLGPFPSLQVRQLLPPYCLEDDKLELTDSISSWFSTSIPLSPLLSAFCCEITGCLKKGRQKERRHTPPKNPNWTVIWKKYFPPHVAY